jgi:hypothetical protein
MTASWRPGPKALEQPGWRFGSDSVHYPFCVHSFNFSNVRFFVLGDSITLEVCPVRCASGDHCWECDLIYEDSVETEGAEMLSFKPSKRTRQQSRICYELVAIVSSTD